MRQYTLQEQSKFSFDLWYANLDGLKWSQIREHQQLQEWWQQVKLTLCS